jgi:hypothetical protein
MAVSFVVWRQYVGYPCGFVAVESLCLLVLACSYKQGGYCVADRQVNAGLLEGGCLSCRELESHFCHRQLAVEYLQ